MITYILRRLLLIVPTIIGITFIVFMLIALSPGGIGAALRGSSGSVATTSGASERLIQEAMLDDRYGLNDPPPVQYLRWLGRISPLKFGRRDLLAPTGELVRYPKQLKLPPLAGEWYGAGQVPEAPPPLPDTTWPQTLPDGPAPGDAGYDEALAAWKNDVYRRASNDYAVARSEYIKTRTILEQALIDYAKAAGKRDVANADNKPRLGRIRTAGVDAENPEYQRMVAAGEKALAAYGTALQVREQIAAVYRAAPYPAAGWGNNTIHIAKPDFGYSFVTKQPVIEMIMDRIWVTLLLNLIAFPIIYLIAIPSGMLAATHQGSWLDTTLGALFVALWSIPIVWAGVLAIGFLASNSGLGWFPVTGLHDNAADTFTFLPSVSNGEWQRGYLLDTLWHLCLPVACIVYGGFAVLSKQTRAAMLDNFNADYVRTAKAKGVSGRDIVLKHVFRNSLLPLITMFVSLFPVMLSGSVVIENIFSIDGMGKLTLDAITYRDRELLLANVFMIGVVNLLALLLADILYAVADPRITYD
ncbi:MAG: ABC transporter permease [Phycisphaerales bacterium]|nr:ABC transporter permease [Phycisphaerales bacterium]